MNKTEKLGVVLAGAALLIAVVAASFWAFGNIEKAAETRKHATIVLKNAGDLLSALKDAETGMRGYALTGDAAFLEPYLAVRNGIGGRLAELNQNALIPASRKHLEALAPLVVGELKYISQVLGLYRKHDV